MSFKVGDIVIRPYSDIPNDTEYKVIEIIDRYIIRVRNIKTGTEFLSGAGNYTYPSKHHKVLE